MASARIPRKRRHCLICKQPFQPIGDEQVCGRCEEQYVRRGREAIDSEHERLETQRKYIEICVNQLRDHQLYRETSVGDKTNSALSVERRLRESFNKGLTTEQAVNEIVEKPPGCRAGCLGMVIVGISLIGLSAVFAIRMLA